ncbi:hypothetical protein ACIPJM_10320 [Streptomyces halstedii]|uniref:hypothetical protein n=1 Tax=Streptomyces halstedii TaxID=1944 RepID=UPI00382F83E4
MGTAPGGSWRKGAPSAGRTASDRGAVRPCGVSALGRTPPPSGPPWGAGDETSPWGAGDEEPRRLSPGVRGASPVFPEAGAESWAAGSGRVAGAAALIRSTAAGTADT